MSEELVQWNKVKGLAKYDLVAALKARAVAKEQIETLTEELAGINSHILNALVTVGVKSVGVEDTRVTLVTPDKSEKLDKKKLWTRLLELGVKQKVVERAYKDSTTYEDRLPYVLVTEPKPGKAA